MNRRWITITEMRRRWVPIGVVYMLQLSCERAMVHIITSISCEDLISPHGVRKDFLVEELQLVLSLIMGILLPRLGLCAIANARPSEGDEIRINSTSGKCVR